MRRLKAMVHWLLLMELTPDGLHLGVKKEAESGSS
jgi:hypothetical protein